MQECCQQGTLPYPRRPRQRAVPAPFFLFPPSEVGTIAQTHKSDLINIRPYKKSDLEEKSHFINTHFIKTHFVKINFIQIHFIKSDHIKSNFIKTHFIKSDLINKASDET